jgi:hypothetical protein
LLCERGDHLLAPLTSDNGAEIASQNLGIYIPFALALCPSGFFLRWRFSFVMGWKAKDAVAWHYLAMRPAIWAFNSINPTFKKTLRGNLQYARKRAFTG